MAHGAVPQIAMSIEEAARALGIGLTSMKELVASGVVSSFRVGRRVLVTRRALIAFAEAREQGGDEAALSGSSGGGLVDDRV